MNNDNNLDICIAGLNCQAGYATALLRFLNTFSFVKAPMKWYFSYYHGNQSMQKTMDSFAAVLILQVRPITGPSGKIEPKYLDFTTKIREKSRELPFKTNAYTGCLWEDGTSYCSKYSL